MAVTNMPIASLRLADLFNTPGGGMDSWCADVYTDLTAAEIAATDTLTSRFKYGETVLVLPLYAASITGSASAPTVSLSGALGSADITTADAVLVIGRNLQKHI